MRAPHGFTLVEVLVALTLLGVGVAAWVGTTALATRIAAAASRESTAQQRARSRAEQLAGGTCASLSTGDDDGASWSVETGRHGARRVRVVVPFADERMPRLAAYELTVLC